MSVYKSSTMGNIPLSFTGKHLLQSEREAVQDLLKKTYDNGYADGTKQARKFTAPGRDWEPLSVARGRIAQRMSELEKKSGYSDAAPVYFHSNPKGPDHWLAQKFREYYDKPSAPVVPSFPGPQRIALEKVTTDELITELKKRFQGLPVRWVPPLDTRTRCILPEIKIDPFVEYGKKPVKRKKKKLKTKKRSRK